MQPIYLARSEKEKCLIEPSINSTRVGRYQNNWHSFYF